MGHFFLFRCSKKNDVLYGYSKNEKGEVLLFLSWHVKFIYDSYFILTPF